MSRIILLIFNLMSKLDDTQYKDPIHENLDSPSCIRVITVFVSRV